MKKRYYGVASTTRKEIQNVRKKDSKGRWTVSMEEVSKPVDIILFSDFENRMDAIHDIKQQAKAYGKLKFEPKLLG